MGTSTSTKPRKSSRTQGLQDRFEKLCQAELIHTSCAEFRKRSAERQILSEPLHMPGELALPVGAAKNRSHLARLCDVPLLEKEDETRLFRRMNFLLYLATKRRNKLKRGWPAELTRSSKSAELAEQLQEVEQIVAEADRIKRHLAAANIRLVVSIVKQLAAASQTFDDLLSEGFVAMIRAVERFDFSRGFRFSTYATMVVRRQLYRSMQNQHRDKTRFPNEPTAIAEEPLLTEPRMEYTAWQKLGDSLRGLFEHLDPRELQIIRARFGFDTDGKKQTLQSLADEFGVCKERVRQLEQRAMSKLQAVAQQHDLHAYLDLEF